MDLTLHGKLRRIAQKVEELCSRYERVAFCLENFKECNLEIIGTNEKMHRQIAVMPFDAAMGRALFTELKNSLAEEINQVTAEVNDLNIDL